MAAVPDPAVIAGILQRAVDYLENNPQGGAAGGGGRGNTIKIKEFEDADAQSWQMWRLAFTNAVTHNGWNHATARAHLSNAMIGTAKNLTAHIPLGTVPVNGEAVHDVEEVLLLYDARFITPAAGAHARNELISAHQHDDESILQWHSRLNTAFRRAYPNRPVAEMNEDRDLVDKFLKNLMNREVGKQAFQMNPENFDQALADALTAESIISQWDMPAAMGSAGQRGMHAMAKTTPPPAINAISPQTKFTGSCRYCNIVGHRAAECRRKINDEGRDRGRSSRGSSNPSRRPASTGHRFGSSRPPYRPPMSGRRGGRGRGGRGRGSFRGRQGNNKYSINALGQSIQVPEDTPHADSYTSAPWFIDEEDVEDIEESKN